MFFGKSMISSVRPKRVHHLRCSLRLLGRPTRRTEKKKSTVREQHHKPRPGRRRADATSGKVGSKLTIRGVHLSQRGSLRVRKTRIS